MEVKKFRNLWYKIKYQLDYQEVDEMFDLIHGEYVHRRLFCSGREYNPRFMGYWFPLGNCHKNALFALFLLEGHYGEHRFKIITNEKHSAIWDTKTNIVYDPTYEAARVDFTNTVDYLGSNHKIVTFDEHLNDIK